MHLEDRLHALDNDQGCCPELHRQLTEVQEEYAVILEKLRCHDHCSVIITPLPDTLDDLLARPQLKTLSEENAVLRGADVAEDEVKLPLSDLATDPVPTMVTKEISSPDTAYWFNLVNSF
ncbi:hypothetical protein NDU88_005685 [Pleurodeles waltl]|uniref:Uncharacterized protein n=1 Tax=Pleurodeles waltl TaxID=8319 RepID=A0AAV7SML9_PLEWA|nr:hypothetical protein NDU88_005685 [Pleurodeles waltl]